MQAYKSLMTDLGLIEVPINTFSYLLVLNANPKHAFFYFTSNFCMVVRCGVVRVT